MDWLDILLRVLEIFGPIGIAATAATMTPNYSKHKNRDRLWRGINAAGMNLGNARNR